MASPQRIALLATRPDRRLPGVVLLASTILLYSLAFVDSEFPLGLLSLLALAPAFDYAGKRPGPIAALGGAAAGALIMALTCGWLVSYHPAALAVGMAVGAFWFALAFGAISAVLKTGSRFALPAALCLWSTAELGRSCGFPAFPYSTLPYALADSQAALTMASFGGVELVGAAIAGCNALVYAGLRYLRHNDKPWPGSAVRLAPVLAFAAAIILAGPSRPPAGSSSGSPIPFASESPPVRPAGAWFRVALVQPSYGAQNGVGDYQAAFRVLSRLSDQAERYEPDLVVWPETAIVPPIEWHLRHRPDRAIYDFIAGANSYLETRRPSMLTGNGYADPEDKGRRSGHNAALLYAGGAITGRYDKVKLVPFSEYLPGSTSMPALRSWLVSRFGELWTPGAGPLLLTAGPARFAAPICFEDSFGRYFASFDNPDFFVVLTNDSWARSASMQAQHLDMSRFRAAETGSIVLRAAETGASVAIAPNGAVVGALPPFVEGTLIVDLPLGTAKTTFYERTGKYFFILPCGLGLACTIACFAPRRRAFSIDKNGSV